MSKKQLVVFKDKYEEVTHGPYTSSKKERYGEGMQGARRAGSNQCSNDAERADIHAPGAPA